MGCVQANAEVSTLKQSVGWSAFTFPASYTAPQAVPPAHPNSTSLVAATAPNTLTLPPTHVTHTYTYTHTYTHTHTLTLTARLEQELANTRMEQQLSDSQKGSP